MKKGILYLNVTEDALAQITRKYPHIAIKLSFIMIIPEQMVYFIARISFLDKKIKREIIKTLKNDKDTYFIKVIRENPTNMEILVSRKKLGSTEKALYETQGILAGPVIIKNGIREYPVFVESYRKGKELEKRTLEYLKLQGKKTRVWFKILEGDEKLSLVTLEEILSSLTDKEKEYLYSSYELGYFEWPRVHSAVEISEYLGISRVTFHENLRRVEKKIMRYIHDAIKMEKKIC